ncbi:MAG: hypothetical protein N2561_06780 [Bacteroidetes bacterium]|nr:hypothetical protein [Rhodothermia bacterium]MCX7907224.1 hypothetical protein [Bacteroidota bacterium]MDW8138050.1 hypothetical protein [Bacteroidota bacterium]MDW8286098.1 hypothetical protein [Bacteroidota bacterium]
MPIHTRLANAVVVGLLLVGGFGCTSVRVSSYVDPAYREATPPKRVVVLADLQDLAWRQSVERATAEELSRAGLEALLALEVAPPTRTWTQESLLEHLKAQGFEALVHVQLLTQGQRLESVPIETVTRVYEKGRPVQEIRTQTQGLEARQYAGLGLRLYALPGGNVLWMGSAFAQNHFSLSGFFTSPDYEQRYALRAAARRLARELGGLLRQSR